MTVIRETTPDLINKVSNLPEVRANLTDDQKAFDWSEAFPMARSGVVVLSNGEDAIQVYEAVGERQWQVCTMFAATCRGKRAVQIGKEMRDYMKPHTDFAFGPVPDYLPQAQWFYRKLGAKPAYELGIDIPHTKEGETMFVFVTEH